MFRTVPTAGRRLLSREVCREDRPLAGVWELGFLECDMVIYSTKYAYLVFVCMPGTELLKPSEFSKEQEQ